MATDMGKKPGDKENRLANQSKKKCKKKKFQGIHDGFLRDHDFCVRMIEHSRDDEVCRRWDVLRSYLPPVRTRILLLQEQMVAQSQ